MSLPDTSNKAFLAQFLGFIKTPPLWKDTSYFSFPQFVLQNDISSEELTQESFPPAMVLGKRIERFFRIYLDQYTDEVVLAENEQIIAEKITLGEFDFILKNRKYGEVSHVEVVYKFYLYDPSKENEIDRWIGPNKKDSLPRKMSRLENRQFPLLYTKEAKLLLDRLQINPAEVEQKVLFRANLFVPLEKIGDNFPLINNDCIQGYWIKYSDFTRARFGKFKFFSPKKPDWPVLPEKNKKWQSFSEAKEQLETFILKQRSPLLWMKKSENEYQRFFVVWW